MTHQEFLKLEDKDLQRYLFIANKIHSVENEIFKIDNEEKIGFYLKTNVLKMNTSGVIYPSKKLASYIVYNKRTKKVVLSCPKSSTLFSYFIREYFNSEKFGIFILNLTKVLVKQIIEGKIKTLSNLMDYHRSYTFKNKKLTDREIITCTYFNCFYLLGCKNLETLNSERVFLIQNKIPSHFFNVPKVKQSIDIDNIDTYDTAQEVYREWFNVQRVKSRSILIDSKK